MDADRSGERRLSDGTCCTVTGSGEPVVLLHGVGLNQGTWANQVAGLARHFSVVTYDHLGHGQSPNITPDTELADFVEQLVRVLDELSIARANLVGFSFGGLVAQSFALTHPDRLTRLVLMSTIYNRTAEEQSGVAGRLAKARKDGPASIIQAAIDRWFSPAFIADRPDVIADIERGLQTNDPTSFLTAYSIFSGVEEDLAGRLTDVRCPALAITGEFDTGSTPAMVERMVADIPDARAKIIKGGRHMMPVEMANEVNAALLAFLTRA